MTVGAQASRPSVDAGHQRCGCWSPTTSHQRGRRTPLSAGRSTLHVVPFCRRVEPRTATATALTRADDEPAPSLYVLNDAALSKPHAIEQLTGDLYSYSIDVAIVSKTHFKTKHAASATDIPRYSILRKDRCVWKGGDVAIYARSIIRSPVWTP